MAIDIELQIVHDISNNTVYAQKNLFIIIFPKQGLNSNLWDQKLGCYSLSHPCLWNLGNLMLSWSNPYHVLVRIEWPVWNSKKVFYCILVSITATWFPLELRWFNFECVEPEIDGIGGPGFDGVRGVLGVFTPSLKMSMLESWLLVKRIFDWRKRNFKIKIFSKI